MKKTTVAVAIFAALLAISIIPTNRGSSTSSGLRRVITIDNTSNPDDLANYQVFLNITYDTDMQSDFDDLRFTWYNDTLGQEVNVDYWLDKCVDAEYALVWVEVPFIRGSGTETLCMYYGDPDATSESNGEETFVFFDGFSTDTTANYQLWSPLYPTGNPNEMSWDPNGWLFVNASIREQSGRNSNMHVYHKTAVTNPSQDNYCLETRCKAFGDGWLDYLGIAKLYKQDSMPQDGNFLRAIVFQGIGANYPMNYSLVDDRWGGPEWGEREDFPIPVKDQWFRIGLGTASNGTVVGSFCDDAYGELSTLVGLTTHQNAPWWIDLTISRVLTDTWATLCAHFDYVRLRKFTDPEPTYTIDDEAALPSIVDIDPDTLNLKSNGEWITAYIELPEGYSVGDIDLATILLNGTFPVDTEAPATVGDYDSDGVLDLMVKFDRASIIAWLGAIDYAEATGRSCLVALTITGEVVGTPFEGSDTINILRK